MRLKVRSRQADRFSKQCPLAFLSGEGWSGVGSLPFPTHPCCLPRSSHLNLCKSD